MPRKRPANSRSRHTKSDEGKPSQAHAKHGSPKAGDNRVAVSPRIIGGLHRGRKLKYSGDPRTRPMKDRVRESLFNLLGTDPKETLAIDLFAGTGALGLESISRGASRAIFLELHRPTAKIIEENIAMLKLEEQCEVLCCDTLEWVKHNPFPVDLPWLVLCSPPYDFFVERREAMREMLQALIQQAPPMSVFAVETDGHAELGDLPFPDQWDTRRYPPAVLSILRLRG